MKPMEGIRVVELAAWTFVPAAGAVLAEWGAEVLKIEHPEGGDPQRGLVSSGLTSGATNDVNFFIEQPNHGKKSIAVNVQMPAGREVIYRLCESADVFLTSWLPGPRQRAQMDVEHIRAVNPNIVYVRGHGYGPKGPDADRGGYDLAAYFARSGVLNALAGGDDTYGPSQPAAFGDLPGGMTIAGGIAAALLERAQTGRAPIVDVSLLSFGMWSNAPDIVISKLLGHPPQRFPRDSLPNPVVNRYLTSDGRLVQLVLLQGVQLWPELLTAMGRPDLASDARFATPEAMFENRQEAIRLLDGLFATRTLDEWKDVLRGLRARVVWSPVQRGIDVYDDPQVQANGYIAEAKSVNGTPFPVVTNPVQFDELPAEVVRAPELGEHTDEVLLELGLEMDEIIELKIANAIL